MIFEIKKSVIQGLAPKQTNVDFTPYSTQISKIRKKVRYCNKKNFPFPSHYLIRPLREKFKKKS